MKPKAAVKPVIRRVVVPFQLKATEDLASHTFEGLAAVIGTMDLGRDIIEPGAFTKTIKAWKGSPDAMPLLNSHDQYDIMSALGQAVELKEQKDGLWSQWEVIDGPEGDAVMRRLMPSKRTGRSIVGKMSIGYMPIKWEIEQPENTESYWDQIRHLTEVELKEVSLVLFPMAPGAAIDASSVKSFMLSAQATDPKSLDVVTKMELRKLNTRIGALLKKHADPTNATADADPDGDAPEHVTPPLAPVVATESTEDEDDTTAIDLSADDALDPDDDTEESDEIDDTDESDESDASTQSPSKGKARSVTLAPTDEPKVYLFSEALQQRLQKTMLKHKTAVKSVD